MNHNLLQLKRLEFSFLLLFYLRISFLLLAEPVLSDDKLFRTCVPERCDDGNGPNISYPFSIPGIHPSHCGYPGFQLTCDNQQPVLKVFASEYIIKNINYEEQFLSVVDKRLMDDTPCPLPPSTLTFTHSVFHIVVSNHNLLFFYNCTEEPELPQYQAIPCIPNNETHHSFARLNFTGSMMSSWNLPKKCEANVSVPVMMDSKPQDNYLELLHRGFLLNWTAPNCSRCLESGGAVAGGGFSLCLIACIFLWYRKKCCLLTSSKLLSRAISLNPSLKSDLEKSNSLLGTQFFDYKELEEATNNFDPSKELGDGGFGVVYHGKLRDGRNVAVKRLYENNCRCVEQFKNEIKILSHLRHQNLVTLYGCSSRHSRELLLVYEFIPNGTVADHLHGDHAKPGAFTWPTRMGIAIETADVLKYLHAVDIIHRDVKTNNILLDNNFHVKVADFGLSRLFPTDVTHVSTAPQGTPGYVDPDYHRCYQLTNKSDVYSFGVVLIELISSKPAVDITRHRHEINLASMAISKIVNSALNELVDPTLGFESDHRVRTMITSVAGLAFRCLQDDKENRPSMEEVLESLRGIASEEYNVEKVEEVNTPADDEVLLKKMPPLSPDAVTDAWESRTTTPNTSG
ncbi:LEAF RUST 10 DISEASE-RESISTANCE LOCUS RECEPTOR-LIKE PROTEIN KINASE-like protein 1.2 isoform X2 [Cinnamomum micranthum f. kanehirae]|uniref:LEAF RUST 10 DISEASE-RESISTANCE LOCUS RECEPTOR-LIKE PROTEIN KINASE-like protein 1.2 isoform X2 n=1 Tax=Cinnamomum micranthum f. kanehirae TaxID=337451 RepID=A0A443NU43_9MAGN|nr:LEAF RUST 10 DISEASE-RESISTANCE LOCUS RECEPTOR-LIKE PROTEIN KINASE-like protein 1.2 isoform X2 [Cinnamomum micranthum f. kanehirae]